MPFGGVVVNRMHEASPSVTSPWPADDRPVIGTAARAALDELVSRPTRRSSDWC